MSRGMVMAAVAADAHNMRETGTQSALLRTAAEHTVVRRTIHAVSGPGSSRWFVGNVAAYDHEAKMFEQLVSSGLLAESPDGRISLTDRGSDALDVQGRAEATLPDNSLR